MTQQTIWSESRIHAEIQGLLVSDTWSYPLLSSFSQYDHYTALPVAPGSAHTLHQTDGTFLSIEADD